MSKSLDQILDLFKTGFLGYEKALELINELEYDEQWHEIPNDSNILITHGAKKNKSCYTIDKDRELVQFPDLQNQEGFNINAYHFKYFQQNHKDIMALYNLSEEEIQAIMAEIAKTTGKNIYTPTAPHSPNSGTLPITNGSPTQGGGVSWISLDEYPDDQLDFDIGNEHFEPAFKGPEPQEAKPHKCKCDWNEVLRYGCKCGGV